MRHADQLAQVDDVPLAWDTADPGAPLVGLGDRAVVGLGHPWEPDLGWQRTVGAGHDPWGHAGSGLGPGYRGELVVDGLVWLRERAYDPATRAFKLVRGPLFTQVLMADEINRTPPKTQSALLEAMQEGQATIDGVSHPLEPGFFVVATQNPVEFEGTYPLPEAQLDRFLLRVEMALPDAEAEREIRESWARHDEHAGH